MKSSASPKQRILALLLILAMMAGPFSMISPRRVQAEGNGTLIVDESFENFAANSVANVWNTASGNAVWNGGDPVSWTCWVNTPSILVEANVEDARDGRYAIRITGDPVTGGRGTFLYTLATHEVAQLEADTEYKVGAWVKSLGNTVPVKFELKQFNGPSSNVSSKASEIGSEWTHMEHTFMATEMGTRVQLGVGMAGVSTSGIVVDKVTLEPVNKVRELVLDKTEAYLEPGGTLQLAVTTKPSSATSEIDFTSSDEGIVSVDEGGLVTAVSTGDARITATARNGKVSAACLVHVVEEYVELEGITLEKTQMTMYPGAEERLALTLRPGNATERLATWSSDNEQVVQVDQAGQVTAIGVGEGTISARVGRFTAQCRITVSESETFKNTEYSFTNGFGQKQELDLKTILGGDGYKILTYPARGKLELQEDGRAYYTSYTWQQASDGDFKDARYTDKAVFSVKKGKESATLTLNITIDTLASLLSGRESMSLLFTKEYLDQIKAEIGGSRREPFQRMLKVADGKMADVPSPYEVPAQNAAYSVDLNQRSTGDTTATFLIAYLLTKDVAGYETKNAAYYAKTVEWLKASLELYPFWGTIFNQNDDLPAGHQLFSVAMCYYWLKDELKDTTCNHYMGEVGTDPSTWRVYENQNILEAMKMRLWKVGRDMYSRNFTYNPYVMNHVHIRMAGLLAAAIVLYDDAPSEAEKEELVKWFGMALYKDGYGINALMPDGTSQEGLPYWEYGTTWVMKAIYMARTALDIDLFDMTGVYSDSADYVLYNGLSMNEWDNSQSLLNIGDSPTYHYNGPSDILRIIGAEYHNGTAQWLAGIYDRKEIGNPDNFWMGLVFGNPAVREVAPTTQTLKWFKDMDHVISRSDWSGNEDILSVKTGIPCGRNLAEMVRKGTYQGDPDAGHAHPDANHITLYSNGEYLLRDDGYCDKYTSNHNTLLVDGRGQMGEGEQWLQERDYITYHANPHIVKAEEVKTEDACYDYIVGDATEAYPGALGLQLYERNMVYLKDEKVLLVVDNIQAGVGTELELRWYTGSKSAGFSGGAYVINSNKNTMAFFPFTTQASFETVTTYSQNHIVTSEKTFRQVSDAGKWQNAVAFSWDKREGEAAFVAYEAGRNPGEHRFGVNGKIYTVNVGTNTVTVTRGELESESGSAKNDSTLSTVLFNGVPYERFDAQTREYTVERWWKTYEPAVNAYTNAYGAKVKVDRDDSGTITVTCLSKDGSDRTEYKFHIVNPRNILGIGDATANAVRDGDELSASYDNVIQVGETKPRWAVQSPIEGLDAGRVIVIYDLVDRVTINKIALATHNSGIRDSYYEMDTSLDKETWSPLIQDATLKRTDDISPNQHATRVVYEGEGVTCRYVRVTLRGHSVSGKDAPGAWNGIQEITFYGQTQGETPVLEKGYAATLSVPDTKVALGDRVNVSIGIDSREWDSFASGELKLAYDGDVLEFMEEASTLGSAKVKADKGILTLEDYGEAKSLGVAYLLAFATKAAGTAKVSLTYAGFSTQVEAAGKDLTSAVISPGEALIRVIRHHRVSLPHFFEGPAEVEDSQDYTFTARDRNLYDYTEVSASMGGRAAEVVENGDGSYTVKNVTDNLTITGIRIPKSFRVTLEGNGKEDLTDAAEVAVYGRDYTFTRPTSESYIYTVTVEYENGNTVPITSLGSTITIAGTDITDSFTITVTRTPVLPTTARIVVEGNGAGDVTYVATAVPGTDYTFTLTRDDRYSYRVSARKGEAGLELTEGDAGAYTIDGGAFRAGDIITITVEREIRLDNVEVMDYLTLNQAKMWLIQIKSSPQGRGTYTYKGERMLWLEERDAYCYLVISSGEAPVVEAGDLAVISQEAVKVSGGMDVNMSGRMDANDSQLLYNMYNNHYQDFTEEVPMVKFLLADVNGDGRIDTRDAQAILYRLLG